MHVRPAWYTQSAGGGTPASEARPSEGTSSVTPGARASGFPNHPSRGLHSRSPLRHYPTASCGACPPIVPEHRCVSARLKGQKKRSAQHGTVP
jgi:hypothetical protein